ncbi:MAG: cell division protein CrgA, partial [Actinobacteria bacterium]|nr:cell division protein CrgA [Actinomycetota bacterium]
MPKSRSKRSSYVPPSKPKPKSSPMWVAALFFTLIAAGVFVIIAHYLGIFPAGTQPYQLW